MNIARRSNMAAAFLLFMTLLATATHSLAQAHAHSLSEVKRLYVGQFQGGGDAERIRQSVIKRLRKSGRFEIVDNPNSAEAVLSATGQTWIRGYVTTNWHAPSTNRQ